MEVHFVYMYYSISYMHVDRMRCIIQLMTKFDSKLGAKNIYSLDYVF
jgi:hypothetical protein